MLLPNTLIGPGEIDVIQESQEACGLANGHSGPLGNKNQAEGTPLMRQWVSRAGLWSLV